MKGTLYSKFYNLKTETNTVVPIFTLLCIEIRFRNNIFMRLNKF